MYLLTNVLQFLIIGRKVVLLRKGPGLLRD